MMTLWRPRTDLRNWSRELDHFFNWETGNGEGRSFAPAVDVEENEEGYLIRADLPGVEEKNVEVSLEDGVLTLSGHREEAKEEEHQGTVMRERRYGSFLRRFRLGNRVAADKIEASYKHGVLSVKLPKAEELKPRQIPVAIS